MKGEIKITFTIGTLLLATVAFAQRPGTDSTYWQKGGINSLTASAQIPSIDSTYWERGGIGSLTASQVSLTNWTAGGQSSIAVNFSHGMFANFQKNRTVWENSLHVAYGIIRQGKSRGVTKSDDRLNIVTKYDYQINSGNTKWSLSALLDFKTQFTKGYDPEDNQTIISDFMAPGYLTVGIGVDYHPKKYLSLSYIPVTGKLTVVTSTQSARLRQERPTFRLRES